MHFCFPVALSSVVIGNANQQSQVREMEVKTMKSAKAIFGLSIIVMMTAAAPFAFAQAAHVRWDIVSINFAAFTAEPGGVASATANDGSYITMTGSGTFVAPAGGFGNARATT